MDNCFTGRRDWSRQTPEKDVLYRIPAGPVRRVHWPGGASYFLFLSRHRDVMASFSFGAWRVKTCFQRQGNFGFIPNSSVLLYPRREAGILWIHHRCRPRPRPRPQRFLVSDLQSTFLSGFLSYLAGGLIW